jgi:hypothetical protein
MIPEVSDILTAIKAKRDSQAKGQQRDAADEVCERLAELSDSIDNLANSLAFTNEVLESHPTSELFVSNVAKLHKRVADKLDPIVNQDRPIPRIVNLDDSGAIDDWEEASDQLASDFALHWEQFVVGILRRVKLLGKVLSDNGNFEEVRIKTQALTLQFMNYQDSPISTDERAAKFHNLLLNWKGVEKIILTLGLSDDVIKFHQMATSEEGASFDLFTSEVQEYFSKTEMAGSIRIFLAD